MATSIQTREFKNLLTLQSTQTLVGNVGDRISATFRVSENTIVNSQDLNTSLFKTSDTTISSPNRNFIKEGFKIGDYVRIRVIEQGNPTPINEVFDVVSNVTITELSFDTGFSFWFDETNDERLEILLLFDNVPNPANTPQKRNGLIGSINFVNQTSTGTINSFIDNEQIRVNFGDLGTLNGSGIIQGTQIGNKSGIYIESSSINDVTISVVGTANSVTRYYDVNFIFYISGAYRPDVFEFGNCPNFYLQLDWSRDYNSTINNGQTIYLDSSNLGYWNEPNNIGTQTFNLITPISEIDFEDEGEYNFEIQSDSISGFVPNGGVGAIYVSDDEDYYKNQIESQINLSMIVPTQSINTPHTSATNPDGAFYTIRIINQSVVGDVFSGTLRFTPSTQFKDFVNNLDDNNKRLVVWVKIDNINVTIFDGQMSQIFPVGSPLLMTDRLIFDHSENITDDAGYLVDYDANIEDDLAFLGKFEVPFFETFEQIQCQIVAFNTSTSDEFVLLSSIFDTTTIPQDASGKYILDESTTIISSLPTTSEKRNALLRLNPSGDTLTDYSISIYFPFLFRWEYWLEQLNASLDFYPNQNKNWLQYGTTGFWKLRVKTSKIKDGLINPNYFQFDIKDYDSNPDIEQQIEIYRDSTGQLIEIIVEGEIHRIVATHTLNNGGIWDESSVWGMITIEPTESSPRWISSTAIPYDNNFSNPLTPLTGSFCDLTFPSPDVARLECYFDANKINLQNGCKFTSKIKGCLLNVDLVKLTTDDQQKTTTTDDLKIKA